MSAMGHEQTSRHVRVMSVIPLKADIYKRRLQVRLVPIADIWEQRVAPTGTRHDLVTRRPQSAGTPRIKPSMNGQA
jgi:hypothetical protein